MEQKTFALKGNIIYTKERTRFEVMEQAGWYVKKAGFGMCIRCFRRN